MRRLSAARLGIALGLLTWSGFSTVEAQSQQTSQRPRPKILVYKTETESKAAVGVMGQVAKPGTYQFAGAPTLQLAVDAAGGLTEAASPMIRIVRNQRAFQRVALHAASKDVLCSGDLVIVDGSPQRPDRPAPETDSGVQLAFLGVVDHPVIVKVHSSRARTDLILHMLGQSQGLLPSVRMISPPNRSFESNLANASRSAPTLSDGTVLLFQRHQIAEAELRDLPEIIPCSLPEPDIGAYGVRNAYEERLSNGAATVRPPEGVPHDFTPERRLLSQMPPQPIDDFPGSSPTLLPDHQIPATLSSTGSSGISSPPVTTLPFSGAAAISARANRTTELPPALPPSAAADTQTPTWTETKNPQAAESTASAVEAADAESSDSSGKPAQSLSIWQMVAVIASAALLVGLALAIRSLPMLQTAGAGETASGSRRSLGAGMPPLEQRRSEAPRASLPTPHIPMTAFAEKPVSTAFGRSPAAEERLELRQQRFAQLINQELSIIEEPLALRPGLIWSPKEVVDPVPRTAAHTSRPLASAASSSAAAIRQIDPPHPQRIPEPHLRTAQESPVERALRQLQGGLT